MLLYNDCHGQGRDYGDEGTPPEDELGNILPRLGHIHGLVLGSDQCIENLLAPFIGDWQHRPFVLRMCLLVGRKAIENLGAKGAEQSLGLRYRKPGISGPLRYQCLAAVHSAVETRHRFRLEAFPP